MIISIGLDLCQISRMEENIQNAHFMMRYFSAEERAYVAERGKMAASSLAAMFAAKEAFVKAMGTGFQTTKLDEIAVLHDAFGAPYYDLRGDMKQNAEQKHIAHTFLSITHEVGLAAAMCVLEG